MEVNLAYVQYCCAYAIGLTIGEKHRSLDWWFGCGAIGAGSWTHSCCSERSQETGMEWSTGCSEKLKGRWRGRRGERKVERAGKIRRKENEVGRQEKKDKNESDNDCVGLLILMDALHTHWLTQKNTKSKKDPEDSKCSLWDDYSYKTHKTTLTNTANPLSSSP